MPIAFACPGCGKQFKVPDEMAGRSTRCNQCGKPLAVPAGPAAISARQPMAPAMPLGSGPTSFQNAGKPVSIARRPRRKMLMLLGTGLLGVIVLAAVGWAGYKFLFGPSGLGDEVRYLPDNCQMVASLRPEQILNSDAVKEIKKEIPGDPEKDVEKFTGLALSNMRQVVIGMSTRSDGSNDSVMVIKTIKPVSADEIKAKQPGGTPQESKVGAVTIYETLFVSWCHPDNQTIVIAVGKSDALKKVLERNKAAELSDGLREALKHADFSKSITLAVDSKEMYTRTKEANKSKGVDFDKMLDQFGIANPMGDIDGGAYQLDFAKDIKLQVVLLCKDAKTSEDMRKIGDGFAVFFKRMFPKFGTDSFETWESSVSGNRLQVGMTIKTESVAKMAAGIEDLFGKQANQQFKPVGQPQGDPPAPPPPQ